MIAVRRATGRDLKVLVSLFEAYRRFYRQKSAPRRARQFLRQRLRRGESIIFLATNAGAAVGFVQLYPSFDSLTMRRLWVLNDLFVPPAARRQGVAQALMTRAARFAKQTRAKGLILETAVDNRAAQKLYETLGWKRDTAFYRYYLDV